jgi:effector-binding domain-containing protein
MIYQCAVREVPTQPILSIRGRTTRAALVSTIGDYLGEVWQFAASTGQLAGPPFTRYHHVAGEDIELEAGLPVRRPVKGAGRVQAGELPGGEVVATLHFGPYDRLRAAGAALDEWARQHGRQAAGPHWQVYWTDPGAVPNPAEWRTEVLKPLLPAGD